MITGDKVSAADAVRRGMVYIVFAEEDFAEKSFLQAAKLAQMPTMGLAYTKNALNISMQNTFSEQLAQEDRLQRKAAATADYKDGITAFIEKRNAVFTGK